MMLHRIVAVLAAVLVSSIGAQDSEPYCRLSSKHTLCRFQGLGPKCGGSVSVSGVDDKNRQIILQTHNSLRSLLASGQESRGLPGPQPSASNMQIMLWDDELAAVAQRLAEQCLFEHDCNECRKVGRFPVGQNLGVEWTTGPAMLSNWKKMITKWYEEVEEFPNTSARKYEFSVVTGHYSQMIWADTNRIGCGFTTYRDNGTFETNLYVCNYGPAGNFIGLPSYKVGPPCSQCPANTACSTRFAGLCEPAKKTSESHSETANEIIPSSTAKPVRLPTKVTTTTPTVVTQLPTITTTTTSVAVTQQRPIAMTTPVAVATSTMPSTPKPLLVTTSTTNAPSSIAANDNSLAEAHRDFIICQIGRGSCRAVYRGVPWIFRAQTTSFSASYLETSVQAGAVTELQIDNKFPAPKTNSHVCMSFKLKQESDLSSRETSRWLLPPLLIKIQPEKSQPVVVPVYSGEDGKWVQLKLTVSRIRAPFRLLFQQTGPTPADELARATSFFRTANLRTALGEMRITQGSCKS